MSEGTCFVGALDGSITEAQLAEVFQPFGQIHLVKILYGKNCAFVEYTHGQSVEAAIQALNGMPLGNGRIRVTRSDKRGGGGGGRPFGGGYAAGGVGGGAGAWAASAPVAPYAAAAPVFVAASAATDPNLLYTQDQDGDDLRFESHAPGKSIDAERRNNAFVGAHADTQAMRLGWQLQTVDYESTIVGRY